MAAFHPQDRFHNASGRKRLRWRYLL